MLTDTSIERVKYIVNIDMNWQSSENLIILVALNDSLLHIQPMNAGRSSSPGPLTSPFTVVTSFART